MLKIAAVVLIFISFEVPRVVAQELGSVKSPGEVDAQVTQILHQCLLRSEGVTAEGVRFTSRAIPTTTEIDEVRSFGEEAFRVLQRSLVSKNARECQLAVRLLGSFKPSLTLEPLLAAVENPNVGTDCRTFTILELRDVAPSMLEPVLLRVSRDSDTGVRRTAQDMLDRLKDKSSADPAFQKQ